jgi:hypothetical protein
MASRFTLDEYLEEFGTNCPRCNTPIDFNNPIGKKTDKLYQYHFIFNLCKKLSCFDIRYEDNGKLLEIRMLNGYPNYGHFDGLENHFLMKKYFSNKDTDFKTVKIKINHISELRKYLIPKDRLDKKVNMMFLLQ